MNIVFVHINQSWYLPYVVYQAKHASPTSCIDLIGSNVHVDGIHNIDCCIYSESSTASMFTQSYKHMSQNAYEFELFCYLRWFYLLDHMRQNGLKAVLYLDSDCMLYSSAQQIQKWLGEECSCALSVLKEDFESLSWCVSGHSSYWTLQSLELFCDFAARSFREKKYLELYNRKWSSGLAGGVCDMTTLYLFWLEHKSSVFNLAACKDGAVFDHNVNLSKNYSLNEYAMYFDHKKIVFKGDRPTLSTRINQEKVIAHALHCQGSAKAYIPAYYRGEPFKGKIRSDLSKFMAVRKERGFYSSRKILRTIRKLFSKRLGK